MSRALADSGRRGGAAAPPGARRNRACGRWPGMRRGRPELVGHKPEPCHQPQAQRQPQHRGPARPVPPHRFRRSEQLIQAHRRQCTRRAAGGVILTDQRPRISPHHCGDGADVPPSVKVATTGRIVAALDTFDDRFPDPGPLADLGNAQTGPLAGLRQHSLDAHPAPPLLYPTTPSRTCQVRRFVSTTWPVYPQNPLPAPGAAHRPACAHPQLRTATGPAACHPGHTPASIKSAPAGYRQPAHQGSPGRRILKPGEQYPASPLT
jgi:hypothetical protein